MAKENIFETIENIELQCKILENLKQEIDKTIENLKLSIVHYKDIIEEHDTYNTEYIGDALAELITEISGREFIYRKVTSKYYVLSNPSGSAFGPSVYRPVADEQCIVVASEKYKPEYHCDKIRELDKVKQLVKDGDAIKLPVWSSSDSVTIYPCPTEYFEFDIEKFGYVRDFIKALIGYCCAKEIKNLDEKTINTCLNDFLLKYKEQQKNKSLTLTK